MKEDGELWRLSRRRQCELLSNTGELDYQRVKRLARPGLGFGGFHTARRQRTLTGYVQLRMGAP